MPDSSLPKLTPRVHHCVGCVCVCVWVWVFAQSLSHVPLFGTPGPVACQVPLSTEFSRQEYWSGLSFPSLGIFPTQEQNPGLLCLLYWQVYPSSYKAQIKVCVCLSLRA